MALSGRKHKTTPNTTRLETALKRGLLNALNSTLEAPKSGSKDIENTNAGGGNRTLTLSPGRDFESRNKNTELTTNKELTENNNSDFAICLAKCLQKYPELQQVIEAWEGLSDQQKSGIIQIVNNRPQEAD